LRSNRCLQRIDANFKNDVVGMFHSTFLAWVEQALQACIYAHKNQVLYLPKPKGLSSLHAAQAMFFVPPVRVIMRLLPAWRANRHNLRQQRPASRTRLVARLPLVLRSRGCLRTPIWNSVLARRLRGSRPHHAKRSH
jgi:hypothetical protein